MIEVFVAVHRGLLQATYPDSLFMPVRAGPVGSGLVASIVAYIRRRRLGCNRVH
jgi:hypothetical protein